MSESLKPTEELQPDSVEPWQISYADLPLIPELEIESETYGGYVSQGFYRALDLGKETIGSDGFTNCSGLILFEPKTQSVLVAHMEPELNEWVLTPPARAASTLIDSLSPQLSTEAVLIQGEASSMQRTVEEAHASGNFGITSLRKVLLPSGKERSWGFVFNKATNKLKAFTREEPGHLITYTLFPQLVSRF